MGRNTGWCNKISTQYSIFIVIPSLEEWPTRAKEAHSPREVRLTSLDTNPVFQCLRGCIIIYFWLKKSLALRLFIDSGIYLISHSYHWHQVFSSTSLVFDISIFSISWRSFGTGLGCASRCWSWVGGILISGLGLDYGMGVRMDADVVVNIFYSYPDIFS